MNPPCNKSRIAPGRGKGLLPIEVGCVLRRIAGRTGIYLPAGGSANSRRLTGLAAVENFLHRSPRNAAKLSSNGQMAVMVLEDRASSDKELIGLARNGDRGAFGELVERHYDFIHRIAWRWAGNRSDAEDIAQDVCVRLGKAIRGFKGEGAFTTWLYAMTLNVARDLKRKEKRDTLKTEAFGVHALISGEEPEEPDDPAERLWAVVRQLPDKQREAVLLVYGEGLSHAAAADAMGVAEATVSWHVHEAKKRLTVLMRSAGED